MLHYPITRPLSSTAQGLQLAISVESSNKESVMGTEDIAAGKVKQIKGMANDIAGAIKGDTAQQIKGKAQKVVGKVQEAMGRESAKQPK
jgi:uncharacterized protein YjbJ (UPF0337 family)